MNRIISIDYQQTIDKLVVILEISSIPLGNIVTKTEVVVIHLDLFRDWCEANELFTVELGSWDDPQPITLTFEEYLNEHLGKEIIAAYIDQYGLAPGLIWANPLPLISETV